MTSLICLALLASAGQAYAQQPSDAGAATEGERATPSQQEAGPREATVQGARLILGAGRADEERLALPCEAGPTAQLERTLYVGCAGEAKILEIDLPEAGAPTIKRTIEAPGVVKSLAVVDGAVWVWTAVTSVEVDALEELARAAKPTAIAPAEFEEPPVEEAPEEAPTPRVVGEVVKLEPGAAIIDLGTRDGLTKKSRIEFYLERKVDLGDGNEVIRQRRLSVAEIDVLGDARARVELGLNEAVPLGALARPTDAQVTSRSITAPRVPGITEISFMARPFLALGTLGGGALMDATVTHRFDIPLTLDLFVTPLAFGAARDGGNVLTFGVDGVVSYDTTPFQVGLGVGTSRAANPDLPSQVAEEPDIASAMIFTTSQFARLGPRDGLNLTVLNFFDLYEGEFSFGGLTATAQIPTNAFMNNTWLILRGGGGARTGHFFGELGIRVLVRGNGLPGSIFMTPTVGGGAVTSVTYERCSPYELPPERSDGYCLNQVTYGGPMIGFGMEWRY